MTFSLFESDGTLPFISVFAHFVSQTMDARQKETNDEP